MIPIQFILLLFANLALAGALSWLWMGSDWQPKKISWTPPAALMPEINSEAGGFATAAPPDPGKYLIVLERPIFAPDRRPPPPVTAVAVSAPPDPLNSTELAGVLTGAGGGVLARVDGKIVRVKLGGMVGAWLLASVDGRDATFQKDGETKVLRLAYAPLGNQPPAMQTPVSPSSIVRGPGPGQQNSEDAARENIRRRNELRAARGLPLLTE